MFEPMLSSLKKNSLHSCLAFCTFNDMKLAIAHKGTTVFLVLLALSLPLISMLSAADFHADGAVHDDCPFCRFQMDGNPTVTLSLAVGVIPVVVHFLSSFEPDLFQRPALCLVANLPNAPPVA